jgi:hypothetical protein
MPRSRKHGIDIDVYFRIHLIQLQVAKIHNPLDYVTCQMYVPIMEKSESI